MKTLTVGELIEALENLPEDMPVVSTIKYGNRASTMQAIPVGEVEDGFYISFRVPRIEIRRADIEVTADHFRTVGITRFVEMGAQRIEPREFSGVVIVI